MPNTIVFDTTAQFTGADQQATIQNVGDSEAISFTPTVSGPIASLTLSFANADFNIIPHDYTGIQIDLCADNAGQPGAVIANIAAAFDTGTIGGFTNVLNVVTVPGGINVTAGTRYWIVITNNANAGNGLGVATCNTDAGTGVAGEFLGNKPNGGAWSISTNNNTFPPAIMQLEVQGASGGGLSRWFDPNLLQIFKFPVNRGLKVACGCMATGKMFLKPSR